MAANVGMKMRVLGKGFRAMWTLKWTLARMATQMFLQIVADFEDLRAVCTAIGTFTCMPANMNNEM